MSAKIVFGLLLALAGLGCGMSDEEVKEAAGNAAVSAKQAAEGAGDTLKRAYEDAAAKGKEAAADASAKLGDAALRAKVLAGFKLVAGLEAKDVTVEVRDGKVYLGGTVPSSLDKMKAEGVAFGVTGDSAKYESSIEVKG